MAQSQMFSRPKKDNLSPGPLRLGPGFLYSPARLTDTIQSTGMIMAGNCLESFEGAKKNQWKVRKKEERLLGIGQIGGGFVEKLDWAYKAITYHPPITSYKAKNREPVISVVTSTDNGF